MENLIFYAVWTIVRKSCHHDFPTRQDGNLSHIIDDFATRRDGNLSHITETVIGSDTTTMSPQSLYVASWEC